MFCFPHKAMWRFYITVTCVCQSSKAWVKLRNLLFLQESFQTLKNWVKELRQHGPPNIVVAIAGNKCDLSDARWIPVPRNTPHPVISVQVEGIHPRWLSTQFDVGKRPAYLPSARPENKPRTRRYRARDSWKQNPVCNLSFQLNCFFLPTGPMICLGSPLLSLAALVSCQCGCILHLETIKTETLNLRDSDRTASIRAINIRENSCDCSQWHFLAKLMPFGDPMLSFILKVDFVSCSLI